MRTLVRLSLKALSPATSLVSIYIYIYMYNYNINSLWRSRSGRR